VSENYDMRFANTETPTQVASHARFAEARRTLHLIDVENLIGDPHPPMTAVAAALDEYRRRIPVGESDLAVLGTNGYLAFATKAAWPGALVRIGRGPDGADLALLEEANTDWVARRFDRVVLASGDGIFTSLVAQLRLLNIEVVVAARPYAVARSLKRVAQVVPIPWEHAAHDLPVAIAT
jgi:hypothetical protein